MLQGAGPGRYHQYYSSPVRSGNTGSMPGFYVSSGQAEPLLSPRAILSREGLLALILLNHKVSIMNRPSLNMCHLP